MGIFIWSLISFFSASIPWAMVIGYVSVKKDVRSVGDNNPGGANAWKLSGWKWGSLAVFLEISKSAVPILLCMRISTIQSWELFVVCAASILGSIFSPFLKFKGGKSLAVTCGIWVGISNGGIAPLLCLLMLCSHVIQKIHIWTILSGLLSILIWVLFFRLSPAIITFWIFNIILVMYKHRKDFKQKIILRDWVYRLYRTS